MSGKRTFRLAGLEYLRMETRPPIVSYAVAMADQLGRLVLGNTAAVPAPSLAGQTLVISKVDHLGDIMFITPVLLELRAQAPTTRLVLLVGGWSVPLVKVLKDIGLCDDYIVRSPWALNIGAPLRRRMLEDLRTAREARRALTALRPAALLDLRCFSPNTLLLAKQAKVPFRAGFALRGLSYTLHAPLNYTEEKPFGQLFLDSLALFGLRPRRYMGPDLGPYAARLDRVAPPEGLPSEPYVVIQVASRNADRNAPVQSWKVVLQHLGSRHPVVFVGGAADQPVVEPLLELVPADRAVNLVGRTSFPQLLMVARRSVGVVSVDSLAAHIGLAMARPTLVLKDVALTPSGSFPQQRPELSLVAKDAPADELRGAAEWLLNQQQPASAPRAVDSP